MALHFDLTKVKGCDKLSSSLKETIIFTTMFVGMGDITEKNCEEFYRRVYTWEAVTGPLRRNTYITLEEVKQFVGLHTNVSLMSKKRFASHMAKVALDTALDKRRRDSGSAHDVQKRSSPGS